MRFFGRRHPPDIPARVEHGFWVTEATAMQRTILGVLTRPERRSGRVNASLRFSPGAGDRVVVLWRNLIVGFVPAGHASPIRSQLVSAGDANLVIDGEVREHAGLWRVWAGPPWPAGDAPEPPVDELTPAPTTIFGIPLTRRGTAATTAAPSEETASRPPGDRWVLAVDNHSWEVRDGTDLDVQLLRRRIADADPDATVHLRLWDETVSVHLGPDTRVTLTDPSTGAVEVLHP